MTLFKEVSAKTGNQVGDAFKLLGEKLMSKPRNRPGQDQGKVMLRNKHSMEMSHPDNPEGQPQKKKCCGSG